MTTTRITHIGGPTARSRWAVAAADRPDLRHPPRGGPPVQLRLGLQLLKADRPGDHRRRPRPVDAVLVSHDHHGDTHSAGRALLPATGAVLTTAAGLGAWAATPAASSHGRPPCSRPGQAAHSGHRHPLASRPTAESPHRPGTWSASPWAGRARPRDPVDHRRHGAVRRRPPGRRPPPGRHRPAPPGMRALPGHRAGALQHDRPGGRRGELPTMTIGRTWRRARLAAFTAEVAASPLARTPYDLRHAAVSTWLNGGVPPTTVAEWSGHSVEVLLRIHASASTAATRSSASASRRPLVRRRSHYGSPLIALRLSKVLRPYDVLPRARAQQSTPAGPARVFVSLR
jgi:hypothetical protein